MGDEPRRRGKARATSKRTRRPSTARPQILNLPWLVHALLTQPIGLREDDVLRELRIGPRTLRKYVKLLRGFRPPGEDGTWDLLRDEGRDGTAWLRLRARPQVAATSDLIARLAAHHLTSEFLAFTGDAGLRRAVHDAQREFSTRLVAKHGSGAVNHVVQNLDRLIALRPDGGTKDYTPHAGTIQTLLGALAFCNPVAFDYPQGDATTRMEVHPLTLTVWRGALYLLARFPAKPRKTYVLSVDRMKRVERLTTHFKYPSAKDYSPASVFDGAFGIWVPSPERRQTILVDLLFEPIPWLQAYVSERTWGKGQKVTKRRDGRLRLSFLVNSLVEVVPWVRQWGTGVRALGGQGLVDTLLRS